MKEKQKQIHDIKESKKQQEIQKTKKIHQNLLKLDKFAKKKLKIINGALGPSTGKASGAQNVSLR